MTTMHFDQGARGFVVGSVGAPTPSGRDITSWWYGPDRALGNVWGGLDYSVAMFASRAGARLAITRAGLARRGLRIYSVEQAIGQAYDELIDSHSRALIDAEDDDGERGAEWWERVLDAQRDRLTELEEWKVMDR